MRDGTIIESSRSVLVHGRMIRSLRKMHGWTQAELAKRAGYSERLIRKAELGGRLMPETIADLSEPWRLRETDRSHFALVLDPFVGQRFPRPPRIALSPHFRSR